MSFTGLLNKSAIVKRKTETKTAIGSYDWTWTNILTFKCRIEENSGSEKVMSGYNSVLVDCILYCLNHDINENDIITVDSKDYEINWVSPINGSSTVHHLEIGLTLRKPNRDAS